jgi:PAS domain S-box-containing protein
MVSIVLTAGIGLVAEQRLSGLASTTTELASRDLPEIFRVATLRGLLYQQASLVGTRENGPAVDAQTARLTQEQQNIASKLEPIGAIASSVVDATLIRPLADGVTGNADLSRQIRALPRGGGSTSPVAVLRSRQHVLVQRLISAAGRLLTLEQNEAAIDAARARNQSRTASRLILTLVGLSVPIAIALAFIFTRALTKPLTSLLRATERMAAGDLEASPEVTSRDEIGQLATAFDVMRMNLRDTIGELESERRQAQAVIDATTDGVIVMDGRRRIVQMNPAAERLSGWTAAEAVGQAWHAVLGCEPERTLPSTPPAADEPLARATQAQDSEGIQGQVTEAEVFVQPRTGRQHWLALSSAPVRWSGSPPSDKRVVLNFHDISELKAVDRLKSDFVAMVSHELRAPLTTVAGAVEMLGNLDPETDGRVRGEVVEILQQQTSRLRKVVEEVLQVTRLEARQLQLRLEPIAITSFLEATRRALTSDWPDAERQVSVDGPEQEIVVWADPGMLELVLRNLLDNARQYTPAGSSIEVEVHAPAPDGQVLIDVADHGPGIPPDQLEHIFDRFARGSRSDWNRGYGLGLYIAREIMHAHGGNALVQNRAGGGSCFTLILRAVNKDEDEPRTELSEYAGAS